MELTLSWPAIISHLIAEGPWDVYNGAKAGDDLYGIPEQITNFRKFLKYYHLEEEWNPDETLVIIHIGGNSGIYPCEDYLTGTKETGCCACTDPESECSAKAQARCLKDLCCEPCRWGVNLCCLQHQRCKPEASSEFLTARFQDLLDQVAGAGKYSERRTLGNHIMLATVPVGVHILEGCPLNSLIPTQSGPKMFSGSIKAVEKPEGVHTLSIFDELPYLQANPMRYGGDKEDPDAYSDPSRLSCAAKSEWSGTPHPDCIWADQLHVKPKAHVELSKMAIAQLAGDSSQQTEQEPS